MPVEPTELTWVIGNFNAGVPMISENLRCDVLGEIIAEFWRGSRTRSETIQLASKNPDYNGLSHDEIMYGVVTTWDLRIIRNNEDRATDDDLGYGNTALNNKEHDAWCRLIRDRTYTIHDDITVNAHSTKPMDGTALSPGRDIWRMPSPTEAGAEAKDEVREDTRMGLGETLALEGADTIWDSCRIVPVEIVLPEQAIETGETGNLRRNIISTRRSNSAEGLGAGAMGGAPGEAVSHSSQEHNPVFGNGLGRHICLTESDQPELEVDQVYLPTVSGSRNPEPRDGMSLSPSHSAGGDLQDAGHSWDMSNARNGAEGHEQYPTDTPQYCDSSPQDVDSLQAISELRDVTPPANTGTDDLDSQEHGTPGENSIHEGHNTQLGSQHQSEDELLESATSGKVFFS
ncbi:hypothetical protein BDP27DRAFT_1417496 [Rhodocollybia butyracea]|uniref:Uncharacterized protein n=1 Tax=Rhodocollybia butyracea TaxID=206335 RepID=A0A9P5Q1N4_9AGAR|nr:hypothetical protein BDP27DRAFT_1417496 [Rhodocollybia butyracea]